MLIYLDASAIASLYNEIEKYHQEMKQIVDLILKNLPTDIFVTSEWSLSKFSVAMRKNNFTLDEGLERIIDLRGVVQVQPIRSDWILKAVDYVFKLNLHAACSPSSCCKIIGL